MQVEYTSVSKKYWVNDTSCIIYSNLIKMIDNPALNTEA
ncbi:hypothetical protein Wcon_01464 [Wolbachia endosymbiont of Cylisticus convexus]|nr:hypothetical protein Wcon_01464 [Wolbachia endosymbiont of Cylisticus convexus]